MNESKVGKLIRVDTEISKALGVLCLVMDESQDALINRAIRNELTRTVDSPEYLERRGQFLTGVDQVVERACDTPTI